MPIFVSGDSADVWSNPDLFLLDEHRRPKVVAGVPPDYFSATGQLWGNPLYDWEALKHSGYAWWVARLAAMLRLVDVVRLDHFRGFEAYWEVPAGSQRPSSGRWVKGAGCRPVRDPARGAGRTAADRRGPGPDHAEDVEALARATWPCRACASCSSPSAASRTTCSCRTTTSSNTVVYTGTHDNDTTVGWFAALPHHERAFLHRYAPWVERDPAWELIRMAWSSVADLALTPLQDVLVLGTEARMNMPGRGVGNWSWRLKGDQLSAATSTGSPT